jgi:hypothetical protein
VLLESLFPIDGGKASPRLARWSTGPPPSGVRKASEVPPVPPAGP